MFKKIWFLLLVLALALSACNTKSATTTPMQGQIAPDSAYPAPNASQPPAEINPYPASGDTALTYAPLGTDKFLERGKAFLENSESTIRRSPTDASKTILHLHGSLPTPCNQLRVNTTVQADQKRIDIEVYSVVDPNQVCATMIQDFEADAPLPGIAPGKYSVYLNGELLGEFEF